MGLENQKKREEKRLGSAREGGSFKMLGGGRGGGGVLWEVRENGF